MPSSGSVLIRTFSQVSTEQLFPWSVAGLRAAPRELHESTFLVLDSVFVQLAQKPERTGTLNKRN